MTETAPIIYKPRLRFALLQYAGIGVFLAWISLFLAAISLWLIGAPLVVFAACLGYGYLWFQARSYELRENGIMVKSGVFSPSQSLLLYTQIQQVEEQQDLMGQILEYTTLNVQTMSGASIASGQLSGLAPVHALALRTAISTRMKPSRTSSAVGLVKGGEKTSAKVQLSAALKTAASAMPIFPIQVMQGTLLTGTSAILFLLIFFGISGLASGGILMAIAYLFFFGIFVVPLTFISTFINLSTLSYQSAEDWLEIKQSFLGDKAIRFRFDRIQNIVVRQPWVYTLANLADVVIDTGESTAVVQSNEKYRITSQIPALRMNDANVLKDNLLEQAGASNRNAQDLRQAYPLDDRKPIKKTLNGAFGLLILCAIAIGVTILLDAVQMRSFDVVREFLLSPVSFVLFGLILALSFLYERAYFKKYQYRTSPTTLSISKGVFGPTAVYLPYSRIQSVFTDQDWFDRIFGLADIHLSTIGAGSIIQAHIDGISVQTAEQFKNELLKRIKANTE
ncbi:PH domain-containing protein [Candidatus Micrarchaeota archaeon]|nr:PH domain-containing protein [Candidatus Micrarchaeota archaeon]